MFGMPVSVGAGGLVMDVDRNLTMTKAKDGTNEKKLQFMRMSGYNSSALEHGVAEQLFSTYENPAYSVSAVRAIQIAGNQGIPIYNVTNNYIGSVLPNLQLDAATLQEIQNAVNAGNDVTTSKTTINFHGWVGSGYIVFNPDTGTGGYMLSGQESGAKVILNMIISIFNSVSGAISSAWDWYVDYGVEVVNQMDFIDQTRSALLDEYYAGFDWCWFAVLFSGLLGIVAFGYALAASSIVATTLATQVALFKLTEMALWAGAIATLTGIIAGITQLTSEIDCVVLER